MRVASSALERRGTDTHAKIYGPLCRPKAIPLAAISPGRVRIYFKRNNRLVYGP